MQRVSGSALVAGKVTDQSGSVNPGTTETLLNVYRGSEQKLTKSETGDNVRPDIRQLVKSAGLPADLIEGSLSCPERASQMMSAPFDEPGNEVNGILRYETDPEIRPTRTAARQRAFVSPKPELAHRKRLALGHPVFEYF